MDWTPHCRHGFGNRARRLPAFPVLMEISRAQLDSTGLQSPQRADRWSSVHLAEAQEARSSPAPRCSMVLPATPQTREHFRWLSAEVAELNGDATVWEGKLTTGDEDQSGRAVRCCGRACLSRNPIGDESEGC